jgi:hypothetical protein
MPLQTRRPLTEKQITANQANSNGVTTRLAEASTRPLLAPCLPSGTARATPLARQFPPKTKITKRTWISINHIESKCCTEIGPWLAGASSPPRPSRPPASLANRTAWPTPTPTVQPQSLENLTRPEGYFDRQYHRSADRLIRLKEKATKRSPESADNTELS